MPASSPCCPSSTPKAERRLAHDSLHPGDLAGVLLERGGERSPALAVVLGSQGSRLQLALGWSAKHLSLPRRDVQPICALPAGAAPPPRLGVAPWVFSADALAAAQPRRRDIGSAWWLLAEARESDLSLAAWCDLVLGGQAPVQLAAGLSLIHISEPTRPFTLSRMPSSA